MEVIGLSGRRGAGKNVVGDYLASAYGFETVAFAEPLKRSAAAVFGFDPACFEEWKNDPNAHIMLEVGYLNNMASVQVLYDITVREYLQRYGTEAHRDVFGKDFWVRELLSSLEEGKRYAITDVRFEDEHRAVRDIGGRVWRVRRDTADSVVDDHSSEALPGPEWVDITVHNNGTVEALHRMIDLLMDPDHALDARA